MYNNPQGYIMYSYWSFINLFISSDEPSKAVKDNYKRLKVQGEQKRTNKCFVA